VHVESVHELRRLEAIAAHLGVVAPVLLRANLAEVAAVPGSTLAMAGRPTPFGIDERHVPAAAASAARSPHLRLDGFHFHSVSNHLDAAAHARLVARYLDQAVRWADQARTPLRVVNAGGGFGVSYGDPAAGFDWDRFVADLGGVLRRHAPAGCSVTFEPGRYVAADHATYAAEVLDVKQTHGTTFVVVRGGTHHFRLPASWQHSHPFGVVAIERRTGPPVPPPAAATTPSGPPARSGSALPRPGVANRRVTVVGQLCSPKDVLARDALVDRVRVGDVVAFARAGAYGWSISHHDFLSHPHPRMTYLG
jgi:diaminopimelate decarboxylase